MAIFVTEEQCQAMIQEAVAAALLKLQRAPRPFKIFALNSSKPYGERVAQNFGGLTHHDEYDFPDGENFAKSGAGSEGNVRGHNVFVIQSLYSDQRCENGNILGESVSDKFVKLCWMIGALKDASAHEVTAIVPHLAWARQDRKTASREPITTKYVAMMLESIGCDRALFIDVHNLSAEQNAFRVPIDNLESKNLHAEWIANDCDPNEKIAIYSPDSGGLARCRRLRGAIVELLKKRKKPPKHNIEIAVFDKTRKQKRDNGRSETEGGSIVGDVEGAQVYLLDDMISTAGTAVKASLAVPSHGGNLKAILATHGLFCGDANDKIDKLPPNTRIVICDTVDPWRLSRENTKKVEVISTCEMIASAIERIQYGTGSISELLDSLPE